MTGKTHLRPARTHPRSTWSRMALGIVAIVLGTVAWSCRPREVVVERPVTRIVTQSADATGPTVIVTVETTVVVTERETVQVVVTSTPTPIPAGGTITRVTYADARTANPILAADPASRALCQWMFEGLLRVDPFTGALAGNFAEGWTVSDDGLRYTFTLRQGLSWSDGQPITAHDFHFSYAALMSGKLDTLNTREVAGITAIEVLDDRTFTVTFAHADCGNLERLRLGWLPMHVFTDDVDTFDFGELAVHEFNSSPWVVSGPFALADWVRGERWVQVRNEAYWQGAPHLDGVITRVVSGQDELVDLLTDARSGVGEGRGDVGEGLRPQYLSQLELAPDLRIWKFMDDGYDFLGFQVGDPEDPQPRLNEDGTLNEAHGEHPILSDVRVRQAIDHAIDRGELIARARLGQGIPLHANVLPTVSWAYNTDLQPREHDLEAAARLLDQAGWALNETTGVRARNGVPLRLDLYTNAGNEIRETMAALIAEQLSEVGIEVEVITVEWYSFLDVLFGQTFDLVLMSIDNLGTNPDDSRLWSAASDVPDSGYNFVSYYNPELESKLDQARSAPGCDQDVRTALYRQIQAQLHDEQPYCWIDVPRNVVAIHERVGGANPGPWSVWHDVHEWFVIE
jgi:peptide/nickel transport system substrate-binding protein